jgi:HSP20 family protein
MPIKSMLNDIAREMDRLFESMLASQPAGFAPTSHGRWAFPAVNVTEDADALFVEAELPGMTMEDVEVLATEDEVILRGTRRDQAPQECRPLRRERPVGAFERTIGLPSPIDVDRVEARLQEGVLTVTLPRSPQAQPRRIDVRGRGS